jgi:hypothetical protein
VARATTGGGGSDPARALAARRRTRRWKTLAAVASLVALAIGAILWLTAGGSSARHAHAAGQHRPLRTSAAQARRPAPPHLADTTPQGSAAPVGVLAAKNPCGLLDPPSINRITGIPVGSGQPIPGGCAWRGPGPLPASADGVTRTDLGGQEGVILQIEGQNGNQQASVTCTANIPGLNAPGGICSLRDGSQYAMFQAHGVQVDLFIRTTRPTDAGQLQQLAALAYSRAAA